MFSLTTVEDKTRGTIAELCSTVLPKLLCSPWGILFPNLPAELQQFAALPESGERNSPMPSCARDMRMNALDCATGEVSNQNGGLHYNRQLVNGLRQNPPDTPRYIKT
jgi:hypothetical protein